MGTVCGVVSPCFTGEDVFDNQRTEAVPLIETKSEMSRPFMGHAALVDTQEGTTLTEGKSRWASSFSTWLWVDSYVKTFAVACHDHVQRLNLDTRLDPDGCSTDLRRICSVETKLLELGEFKGYCYLMYSNQQLASESLAIVVLYENSAVTQGGKIDLGSQCKIRGGAMEACSYIARDFTKYRATIGKHATSFSPFQIVLQNMVHSLARMGLLTSMTAGGLDG